MIRDRNTLLRIFGLLVLLMGCPFLVHSFLDGDVYGETELFTFFWWVPVMMALLLASPILPPITRLPRRIALALWLALLLRAGFNPYVKHGFPLLLGSWGVYISYCIFGLLAGIPLVVVVSKRLASLGPIKLTVMAGFLVVLARYAIEISPWYNRYLAASDVIYEPDWARHLLLWLQSTDWIIYRLPAYVGLGYLMARHKGLVRAAIIGTMIAVADTVIAWLLMWWGVYQLRSGAVFMREAGLLNLIIADLQPRLAQVTLLGTAALLGALVTLIPWSAVFRPSVRYVYPGKSRRRPAQHVTPDTEAG